MSLKDSWFRSVFEYAAIGMALVDLEGRCLAANRPLCEMLGYTEAELLCKFQSLTHPDDAEAEVRLGRQLLAGETPAFRIEKRYFHKRGHIVWALLSTSLVRDAQGQPLYVIYQVQDITEHQRRKAALQESEERYRSLIETLVDGIMLIGLDGRVLVCNHQTAILHGFDSAEELVGTNVVDLVAPQDRQRAIDNLQQVLETGSARNIEYALRRKDGACFPAEVSMSAIFGPDGRPRSLVGVARDITARKQAEAELAAHARQQAVVAELGQRALVGADLSALVNTAIQLVVRTLDVEYCKVLRLLPDGRAMLFQGGVDTRDAPVGQGQADPISDYAFDYVSDYAMLSRGPLMVEEDMSASIALDSSSSPNQGPIHGASVILQGRGQSLGILGAYTARQRTFTEDDLNFLQAIANVLAGSIERKQAEEALQSSEERYRTLFENAVEGIAVLAEGRVALANSAFARILGYDDAPAVVGRTVSDLMPSTVHDQVQDWFRRWQGEAISFPRIQGHMFRQDGAEIDVLIYGATIVYDGRPAVLIFLHDITEQLWNEQRTATIHQIGQAVTASLDLDEIFNRIVQGLERLLPFDQASLSLLEDGRRFCVARSPALPGADGLPGLSTPLTLHGQTIGVLNLVSSGLNRYTSRDRDLLSQLAPEIAIAIENARLYDQVRAGRERLQSLSQQLVRVQELERRHIARELHDEVGQSLTGLNLLLGMTSRLPPDEIRESLGEAQSMLNNLLAQVREMSLNLRPAMLDDLGLLPTLLWHIERYSAATHVRVTFKHSQLEERFPQEVETAAYRVVQEGLTNVARHASVGEVTVRLWATDDALCVQVQDNGVGFDAESALAAGVSSGLAGMRERVELLSGHLTIESLPGAGACLTAEMPLRDSFGGGADQNRVNRDEHHDDCVGR
jgi:PAS domain S-box-containing protein